MNADDFRPAARRLRLRPLAACLASALFVPAGAFGAAAKPTPAGALVVTNCADAGAGSLRAAVAQATDGATVDASQLACAAISLSSGAIASTLPSLTIRGPGSAALTISGNDASRVLEHHGSGTLTLTGLTLTHGRAADSGGCVVADGSLTLTDVALVSCAAGDASVSGNRGGGAAVAGNATLTDATFVGNTLDGTGRVRGGALAVGGTLTAVGSTFANNRVWNRGNSFNSVAEGGAIFALGATQLTDSTITGNTGHSNGAEVFGGGLAVGSHPDHLSASLDVLRGAISGNVAYSYCGVCAPQGGGIAAVGGVRLRSLTLTGNTVGSPGRYGAAGGLRAFQSPSVEIDDSVVAGNHADSAGGGVIAAEYGYLYIDGTTIADNYAGNDGGTDEGGGGVLCRGCSLQLTSSTVSGNTAGADGGGVNLSFGEYGPAPSSIVDSTISGNTAYEGGGVLVDGGGAQFSNSTIAFNHASFRGAGISGSQYTYQIDLQSTIVSNNLTGANESDVWTSAEVTGANNLIQHAAGASMPPGTITADPLLQPLADNGGATQTHALGDGSPAIDAGNDSSGLVFDQRGAGFVRVSGAAADIGAFELQQGGAVPTLAKRFDPAVVSAGSLSTLTITLTNANGSPATLTAALTDTLPGGVVVADPPQAATDCAGGSVDGTAGATAVTLGAGAQIPAVGSCTVTITVTAPAAGTFENVIPAGALQTDFGANPDAAT
ncbi:MAG TPA: choice-of-anchor Q domain-containing protein, partial [Dokdonella sp.]